VLAVHGRAVRGRSGRVRWRSNVARMLGIGHLVAEQDVGVEVVLLRARDRELRHGGGLSTATRRWRPVEARGCRGARARGQEGRGTAAGEARGDAWVLAEAGGGT
jgi:hypothetical protein